MQAAAARSVQPCRPGAAAAGSRRAFGVAAPPPAAVRRQAAVCHAKVELQDLEGAMHHLEVPENENVLDVALEQGVDVPYDCKMGVCLRCAAKLDSGKVDQPGSMINEEAQEEGYTLLCVAYPTADCSIRVIPEDELAIAVLATS
ncbi:root R-B2 [Chlorella sorokiniana]|uniref:Ferredoxin n=1 Tax=Chlorella sorokiniana TaxID=3076 RepID=A0A2P6TP80_CHLSO|nr:root R-B2 [Chlorella sorokiniana]|eukprot:PRW51141.1 root R-B2 [Chlorella sorokiniana]